MTTINRRALLASIASSVLFAASPAKAFTCDARRERRDNISTKTYNCSVGENSSLSATFVRMSDVVADTIGSQGTLGGYESLFDTNQMVENSPLELFNSLLTEFSFPIETPQITVEFNGREDDEQSRHEILHNKLRLRTLGFWDAPSMDSLPFFPLPDELRRAMQLSSAGQPKEFLRYATLEDFDKLEEKKREYVRLWQEKSNEIAPIAPLAGLGNLDLMAHIGAGSVSNFLPLYFSSIFSDGCTTKISGGAHFVPPALHVDAMVCKNTGSEPLKLDDFFGANDTVQFLRPYSPSTPTGEGRLGWGPIDLAPGENIVAIQRLLFGAADVTDRNTDQTQSFDRAIYGPAQLPKGVVIAGEDFAFDGRSHNALIVASYAGAGSCPYLMSWCDQAQEWVALGKVIAKCNSAACIGEECRRFHDLRTRFKLVEREHTFIHALSLEVKMLDGTSVCIESPAFQPGKALDWPVTLEIGREFEFSFCLPASVREEDIVQTTLNIRGYYEKYSQADFEKRSQALLLDA